MQRHGRSAPDAGGANVVKVEVANPEALQKGAADADLPLPRVPKWTGDIQSIQHIVKKSGETFRVEVAQSEKLPQMRDSTLRYGKLAWNPEK